jgi:microcystin-dependent protein
MGSPYVGEIRMCGFNFAPVNWAFCNGQLLDISQFSTLFQLIGTTYGGNGQTNFALPNLQSRIPMNQGQGLGLANYVMGQAAGTETITLTTQTMPGHTHTLSASQNTVTTNLPSGNIFGTGALPSPGTAYFYTSASPFATGTLFPQTVTNTGSSLPHPNLMPLLCVNFIISLFGIFPSQG